MKTEFIIVWALTIAAVVFLGFFFMKRLHKNKVLRKEATLEYAKRKEKYTYLKPGILDECPKEDIPAAVLFHCIRKEDEDFDHYFEKFNESEKIVYGIYQITLSLEGAHPSLHSFFLSPSTKCYVPIIVDIFETVGAHEIAELMRAARRFAEIIDNGEEDDENDPEMGDYTKYNFSDFTNEFISLVNTTNLNEKITNYILAHKEDFYDENIPSDAIEMGEKEDEGISD